MWKKYDFLVGYLRGGDFKKNPKSGVLTWFFKKSTCRRKVYDVGHVARHSHCSWFVLEKERKARLWFMKPFGNLLT
jgi:hypothetical protein